MCEKDDDCDDDRTCLNKECVNPCDNACGVTAKCQVKKHVTVCSCPPGYIGDPLDKCSGTILSR